MKILIICTGNTCRSQMAEGFLKSFLNNAQVFSAGTRAETHVNPYAVRVMQEKNLDISHQKPTNVSEYSNESFDYVITVCDNAKNSCPVFTGPVNHRLHFPFDDPADATGTDEEKLAVYRRVRDEIEKKFKQFTNQIQ